MSDKSQNLQDIFLNALRKSKTPVTMFLVKGVKLQGIITWFDNFSLLLRRDGQFEHELVARVPQGWTPQEVDLMLVGHPAKIVHEPNGFRARKSEFVGVA